MSTEIESAGQADHVLQLLARHVTDGDPMGLGFGSDAFHAHPIHHPMAMALYLEGCCELYAATQDAWWLEQSSRLVSELKECAVRSVRGLGWGLGFSWRSAPADGIYTVTTATVARALAVACTCVDDRTAPALLASAVQFLTYDIPWRVGPRGAAPWYAPTLPFVVPNVASMTTAALVASIPHVGADVTPAVTATREFVRSTQDVSGGWRYGETDRTARGRLRPSDVVDALHHTYAQAGLDTHDHDPRSSAHRFAARHLHRGDGTLRERVLLLRRDDEFTDRLRRRRDVMVVRDGPTLMARFETESRLAAYGAMIGELVAHPTAASPPLLEALVARMVDRHGRDASGRFRYTAVDDSTFPRQEAHLFWGLARYVRHTSPSPTVDRDPRP
ncbi:MAG: hypothetical protein M0P31_10330 [Solirubrobacteraceae bacterium]|nr:hypothetical protein [Solirubrobacteraceae bacterium]